jgi:TRAP-type mannitol/chloroaromatic compound transport system permease small subunit
VPVFIDRIFVFIGLLTEKIGRVACYLVFLIMLITTSEVIARYVFNSPTNYAWPLNRQLFGIFILFAGAYTMRMGGHIRIEIFYDRFPPKVRLAARVIGLAACLLFLGTLVWQGSWMGLNSLMMNEKVAGGFRIPLYPFKLLIPLAAILFFAQSVAVFFRERPPRKRKEKDQEERE